MPAQPGKAGADDRRSLQQSPDRETRLLKSLQSLHAHAELRAFEPWPFPMPNGLYGSESRELAWGMSAFGSFVWRTATASDADTASIFGTTGS